MTTNMKKLTALSSLIVLSAFVFFTNTTQAEFVAGKNYIVLDKAVETETIDLVEVRELFGISVLIVFQYTLCLITGSKQ